MFKAGDKVVLKKSRRENFFTTGMNYSSYNGFYGGVNDEMKDLVKDNKYFTVRSGNSMCFSIEEGGFSWDNNWFELYVIDKEYEVGELVKVTTKSLYSYARNGVVGCVVDSKPEYGYLGSNSISIKISASKDRSVMREGEIWGFDKSRTTIERIATPKTKKTEAKAEKTKKEVKEIIIVTDGTKTTAVVGEKVGRARRKEDDVHVEAIATLIAVARAYKIDNDKVEKIIDVLYDDVKPEFELEKVSLKELCLELTKRMERR